MKKLKLIASYVRLITYIYIYIHVYIYIYIIYNLQLTSHYVQVPYPAVSTVINKNEREAFSRKSNIASD